MGLATSVYDPSSGSPGYDPSIVREIARLPHVKHVESWAGLNVLPLGPNGAPTGQGGGSAGGGSGSVDGLYFNQDRFTVDGGPDRQPCKSRRVHYQRSGCPAFRLAFR